ncbi:hypothetical protein LEP1GSC016_1842 [Leptospira borgpetersenii serovar Hardjo-bovis str. Sponselee]|uniref:Uncharacterized protein n=1 Tax=Leptospira borgpetersenii serovar Hardjo-bovis str. Sponselee TaxID=1303729 RepID=M6BNI4_LEPBO|nr:hypothetical protein LEP1GSC016_1842 [Leptospira borgpetersenii serovar Hardjo-bovis str. Sponselee]
MGDLKNMRKKIYCSGWGAISELVSESAAGPIEVAVALSFFEN